MENQFDSDNSNIATSLNNLAGIYVSRGKYKEAESLYEKSLEIKRKFFGEIMLKLLEVIII